MTRTPETDWTIPSLRHRIKELEVARANDCGEYEARIAELEAEVERLREELVQKRKTKLTFKAGGAFGMPKDRIIPAEGDSDD